MKIYPDPTYKIPYRRRPRLRVGWWVYFRTPALGQGKFKYGKITEIYRDKREIWTLRIEEFTEGIEYAGSLNEYSIHPGNIIHIVRRGKL